MLQGPHFAEARGYAVISTLLSPTQTLGRRDSAVQAVSLDLGVLELYGRDRMVLWEII